MRLNILAKRVVMAVLGLTLAGALSSCGPGVYETTNKTPVRVPVGTVVNPELRIVAADGSFTLAGGQQFTTPFSVDIWSTNQPAFADANIINGFTQGRAVGGRDVMVHVQGKSKPLYGVLVLSTVWGSAVGPATRSYQIQIPKDKIDNAYAGNTSVVYENVLFTRTWNTGASQANNQWRTWILWLSATPL